MKITPAAVFPWIYLSNNSQIVDIRRLLLALKLTWFWGPAEILLLHHHHFSFMLLHIKPYACAMYIYCWRKLFPGSLPHPVSLRREKRRSVLLGIPSMNRTALLTSSIMALTFLCWQNTMSFKCLILSRRLAVSVCRSLDLKQPGDMDGAKKGLLIAFPGISHLRSILVKLILISLSEGISLKCFLYGSSFFYLLATLASVVSVSSNRWRCCSCSCSFIWSWVFSCKIKYI